MAQIKLILFNLKSNDKFVKDLAAMYGNSGKFDLKVLSSVDDVFEQVAEAGHAILLFGVHSKENLQEAIFVIKSNKKLQKKSMFRAACILPKKNKKVEKVLLKYGCMDILEGDVNPKTVGYKIDFWARPIEVALKKQDNENALAKKKVSAAAAASSKKKTDFVMIKPLTLGSDFWIIKHKNDCKKILKKYLLKILGPSPHIGNWVELEARPGDRFPTWMYELHEKTDQTFIKDDGGWYYSGDKPDFDWKISRWSFSGEMPHLYFYGGDGSSYSRFKFSDGQVKVAENSRFANLREELILETCKGDFSVTGKDGDVLEDLEGNTEGLDEDGGHLSGKSSTDDLGGDSLEGKSRGEEDLAGNMDGKGSTDELNGDPLRGKSKGEDALAGNMDGKSSTDELNGDPLRGKSKGEDALPGNMGGKSSTDDLGGNLDGKSSTDDVGTDPLAGKSKGEDALPGHMGGKSSTDDLGGNLDGKSSTDDVGTDPLAGKSKGEDALPGNMGGKSSTDDLGGNLDGKSSTDDVGTDPLAGKSKGEDALAGHMGGKSSTDDLGGNLDGKSSTDDVGTDPLAGKSKGEDALPGHMGGKSSTDDLGGNLDGKSSTDDVGTDPLAGKSKGEDALPGNMGGKSSTDDLGGNLDGKSSTDDVGTDPLAGKSKGEDALPGHMDGKSSTDDLGGDLDGEGKTDALNGDPLAGKSSTDDVGTDPLAGKNKSEAPIEGHMNGKAETDDLGADPLDGKSTTDNIGTDPLAGKTKGEGSIPGHMDGKKKDTDDIGTDPLAGKAGGDTPGEKPMNGKSSTDKLTKKPLAGKAGQGAAKKEAEQRAPEEIMAQELALAMEDLNNPNAPTLDAEFSPAEGAAADPFAPAKSSEDDLFGTNETEEDNPFADMTPKIDPEKIQKRLDEKIQRRKDEAAAAALAETSSKVVPKKIDPIKAENTGSAVDPLDQVGKKASGEEYKSLNEQDVSKKEEAKKNEQAIAKAKAPGEIHGNNGAPAKAEANKDIEANAKAKPAQANASNKKQRLESEMSDILGGGLVDDQLSPVLPSVIDGEAAKAKQANGDITDLSLVEETIFEDEDETEEAGPISLESGDLKVTLKQKTKVGNSIRFICDFVDFYEDELIVYAPKDSLAVNSEVLANVVLDYNGQKIKVPCSGKIEEIEEHTDRLDSLIISLDNTDKKLYETFLSLYGERQASIHNFMKKAKGY